MTYTELIKANKEKALKEVIATLGNDMTESVIYNNIYDLSEKMNSVEHAELINNLIIKADFAGMDKESIEAITEAWEHFKENEAYLSRQF